jgi:hypothetical protein
MYSLLRHLFLANKNSARSTSAAPIYFKPYYHRRTRKTYIDGALRRNNPIRVADEERRAIWPNDKLRPDLVLSLGTGIGIEQHQQHRRQVNANNKKRVKETVPKGLRKNISTAYDMIASTLNCEKEWDDFLYAHRDDRCFVSNCHRINVALFERPPKLDDVSQMNMLQDKAIDYLEKGRSQINGGIPPYTNKKYRNAHEHIKVVADRMIATLFYFDDTARHNDPPAISGFLRCRLSPSMRKQFASILDSGPEFRVQDRDRRARNFIRQPQFNMNTFSSPVRFLVGEPVTGYWIEIRIRSRNADWQPIGGF